MQFSRALAWPDQAVGLRKRGGTVEKIHVGTTFAKLVSDLPNQAKGCPCRSAPHADASDSQTLELRNRRYAIGGEDVDRTADMPRDFRDCLRVDCSDWKEAVGPRIVVGIPTIYRLIQPAGLVTLI